MDGRRPRGKSASRSESSSQSALRVIGPCLLALTGGAMLLLGTPPSSPPTLRQQRERSLASSPPPYILDLMRQAGLNAEPQRSAESALSPPPPPPLEGKEQEKKEAPADKAGRDRDRTMHTFYDPIDPTRQSGKVDQSTARAMLDVWRESWESRGWKTAVLTLDDARRHPLYDAIDSKLDGVPLDGWGGTKYYNRLCYLRWLAMAAVGGGWMSDYDVVPLFSPPDGAEMDALRRRGERGIGRGDGDGFTVFGEGGVVPSLLYGTEGGWLRMVQSLVESGLRHADGTTKLWSDMMALMALGGKNGRVPESAKRHYELRDEVVGGKFALLGRPYRDEDCAAVAGKGKSNKAVHFSHNAMINGKLEEGKSVADRPDIIRDWVRMYRERCEGGSRSKEA